MKGTFCHFRQPPLGKMLLDYAVRPRSVWWVDSTPVKDAPPLLTVGGHLGCDHAVKIASLPLVTNENHTKKTTLARLKYNQPHALA